MRFLGIIRFAIWVFLVVPGFLLGEELGKETHWDSLIAEGLTRNEAIRAAYDRVDASRQRIPQAVALPDPVVAYGYYLQAMETRQLFRIEQGIPGWGKRSAMKSVAEAEVAVALDSLAADIAQLRRDLIVALAEIYRVEQSALIFEGQRVLVRQLLEIREQGFRSGGNVSQVEILRLQMELAKLNVEIKDWEERGKAALAEFNALRSSPVGTPVGDLGRLPDWGIPAEAASGSNVTASANPDLRRGESFLFREKQATELANRQGRPDFMVGVEYMDNRMGNRDEIMGMVAVSVPIWRGRYDGLRREALANQRAAERDLTNLRQRVDAELWVAASRGRELARRSQLLEDDLIPRVKQMETLLESGYQSGSVQIADLLEIRRDSLDLQLQLLNSQVDSMATYAEWERLTGKIPLSEGGDGANTTP